MIITLLLFTYYCGNHSNWMSGLQMWGQQQNTGLLQCVLIKAIRLTYNLTDRMFEKLVENLMPARPVRPLTHANSFNNRSREHKQQLPDLAIRKVKSADYELPRLVVAMWETESTYEMFDYENSTIKPKEFKLESEHDIYISDIDKRHSKCIVTKGSASNDNTYCGTIDRSKGSYYFIPGTTVQTYKVLSSEDKNIHILEAGNLMRVGRMRYFIKEIYDGFQTKNKDFKRKGNAKQLNIKSLALGTCKFCLCDEKDSHDLLISPCNCKGSCAQVHLGCLKQWLANKVSRKSTSYVEFLNYDNFSCELCKEELPIVFQIDGKSYNMLAENTIASNPYIIMEGIPSSKSSTKNNMTIKINFKGKNNLVLGRGHEADVRLEDVSISRQHCYINFINNRFELVDNKSKFGTLLKVQPGQKINLHENKLQIARMTLEMTRTCTANQNTRF